MHIKTKFGALIHLFLGVVLTGIAGCTAARQVSVAPIPEKMGECVILLHGLARSSKSMVKLENNLRNAGYLVANINYKSRSARIEELAISAVGQGLSECRESNATTIHVVTHSMGGIMLRYYMREEGIPEFGRSVMLAPPNKGSEAVDACRRIPGIGWFFGVAGFQLGTDAQSLPQQLGPVTFDLGVIAANRSLDPITSLMLPNPDDGKVSVASTRIEGMQDFLVVRHTHTFIMKADIVQKQVLYYLEHGEFDHLTTSIH